MHGRFTSTWLVFLVAGLCVSAPGLNRPRAASLQTAAVPVAPPAQAFVNQYCVSCHNTRVKTGGLALDALDPTRVASEAEIWEKVVRKLRSGLLYRAPNDNRLDVTSLAVVSSTCAH